jgi:hypothetical protein
MAHTLPPKGLIVTDSRADCTKNDGGLSSARWAEFGMPNPCRSCAVRLPCLSRPGHYARSSYAQEM